MESMTAAALVAGAWLCREVGAVAVKWAAARFGRFEYVIGSRCFVRSFSFENGTSADGIYIPTAADPDDPYPRVVFDGSFVNETATPMTFRGAQIVFYGSDGPRSIHSTPAVIVGGQHGPVFTVPANGHSNVRLHTTLISADLSTIYTGAVAVLEVVTVRGRKLQFALHLGQLWGDEYVRWDKRRHRVAKRGTRQWIQALD